MYKKNWLKNQRRIYTLCILLSFFLSGCGYFAYQETFIDPATYSEIWSLSGVDSGFEQGTSIFPSSISDLDVEEYYCRYDEQLPLGIGFQVLLKIHYPNSDAFINEVERITSLGFSCDEHFEEISGHIYATKFADSYSFEYAIIDQNEQALYYIFLQDIPEEEIEFDHHYLPKNYSDLTQEWVFD